jgi:dihydroorotate dehydrogenase (fumarate)
MELSCQYLGLQLRHPLVASASPMAGGLDGVRRLADAGLAAIVLPSLFEEELRREAAQNAAAWETGIDSFGESLSYFPNIDGLDPNPSRYLSLVERAVAAVDVPVIASLNAVTASGWTGYASELERAGAAAIELNIYHLPTDPPPTSPSPFIPGREVEQRHIEILAAVKAAVSIPVAVKLNP